MTIACSRLQDSGEKGSKKSAKNRVRTGERECGGACKHCFKYLIPIYQLLVYPLIGLFLTVYFNTYVIYLASRALNKHREQISRPWFQWTEFSLFSFFLFLCLTCNNKAKSAYFRRQKYYRDFLRYFKQSRVMLIFFGKKRCDLKTQNPFNVWKTRSAIQRILL